MGKGQYWLGRILLIIGILLGAFVLTNDVTKALALSSMIVATCTLIRGNL